MFDISTLQNLNESEIKVETHNEFAILCDDNSDYFNSPELKDGELVVTRTAPFYYQEMTGDFTIKVQVKNNFTTEYDAGAIFIYEDDYKWIKLAYEKTDFNTDAIVTVITDGPSDDANGANVEQEWIHLMASRLGNVFALHYSLDGIKYDMVRFFRLEMNETVKVGLTAQAPAGKGKERIFKDLEITEYALSNLRKGVFL